MFSYFTVIILLLIYTAVLFMIAKWAEKRSDEGRSVVNNAIVYSLSLAVYCTSWTYYGSVGKAANSGMMFLTIYLGPTLGVILWWVILKKLVVIKNEFRITSMADVISIRYGKSSALAVISTVACLIGITPYLALQLKAMVSTFNIIASGTGAGSTWLSQNIPILLVCWVIIFTIIFGARKLAPSERHEGIIAVLAVESIVKLVAFLGVGIFVAFFMYDGPLDILKKFSESKHQDLFKFGREGGGTYVMWMSYLILAMSAIMFLPRQFHVAVVENSNKNHIKTAMWLFPTYLFMINIFVVPIALGGLLAGVPIEQADSYVLRLPLLNEVNWLALFAFLGGFSAATGMIMISTMTLSTMASNHLILPFLAWFKPLSHLRKYILQIRWFAIVVIIFTGYMFFRFIGESYILVNMGMFSFAAVLQFAPVIIGGLFWHKGNRAGAILGLSAGFLVWFYTLLVPALVQSGWLPVELLNEGLLGMNWLRPRQLFNLEGFDPISHTVFWTMFFNIGLYVLGSLFFKQGSVELETADKFTRDSKSEAESTIEVSSVIDLSIPLNEKVDELKSVFGQYFPKGVVNSELDEVVDKAQLNKKKNISIAELGRLHERAEQRLAGTIGAATARVAMKDNITLTHEESGKLSELYMHMIQSLNVTPQDLREKLDFYKEREKLLGKHSLELEEKVLERDEQITKRKIAENKANRLNLELEERVVERTRQLEVVNRELESFSYSISHDLRSPLRAIDGFSKALLEDYEDKLDETGVDFLNRVRNGSQRMGELINDILKLSRFTRSEMKIEMVDLSATATSILEELVMAAPDSTVETLIHPGIEAVCDKTLIRAVIQNLLANAWKFSSKEDEPLIEFGKELKEGEWVYFIKDNGVGFDEKYGDKLFSPFQRLHSVNEFPGSGIGLATVKRIITRHNGTVWAKSEENKGAVFYFTLDLNKGVNDDV